MTSLRSSETLSLITINVRGLPVCTDQFIVSQDFYVVSICSSEIPAPVSCLVTATAITYVAESIISSGSDYNEESHRCNRIKALG